MKKIISIFIISALAIGCAYSQVEIRGNYKGSQLHIVAQRTPGGGQDKIEKVEYAPLTQLEQKVASLQKQIESLRKELSNSKAEIGRSKRGQTANEKILSDSLQRVQQKMVQKERELNEMRTEVENLKVSLQKIQDINDSTIAALESQIEGLTIRSYQNNQKNKVKNYNYLSLNMELGAARFNNDCLRNDKWMKHISLDIQQLMITYTYYPTNEIPVAIKTGIGLSMYHSRASYFSEGR